MFQEIEDEVLDFSGQSDTMPRYTMRDNNGNVINDNVQIELKTPVVNEGTPLNKATLGNIQGDLYTVDKYIDIDESNTVLENSVDYWDSLSTSYSDTIYSTTYGNGVHVATGQNGLILYSTDGKSWTKRTTSITTRLYCQYGDGLFIAVSTDGYYTTSADGITWSTPVYIAGSTISVYGFKYVNGIFFALSSSGSGSYYTLSISNPSSLTWTKRTFSNTTTTYDITYGNGLYVVVGANGLILTSSSGTSAWTSRTSGVTYQFNAVAYGLGKFIATSSNTTGTCVSEDGINWVTKSLGNYGYITFDNGTFCLYGTNGVLKTSVDGENFTQVGNRTENITLYSPTSLIYANERWIGGGASAKFTISGYTAKISLDIPLSSYENQKILNIKCNSVQEVENFFKPTININNLGEKETFPTTIRNGELYSFIYDGEKWTTDYTTDNFERIKTLLKNSLSCKVAAGSFSSPNGTKTTSVGFKPDLVICYNTSNNSDSTAVHTNNASYSHVPKILTNQRASEGSSYITSSGFVFGGTASGQGATIYYIAIKFGGV